MKTLDARTQIRRLLVAATGLVLLLLMLIFAWKVLSMTRYRYIEAGAGKLYRIDRWTDRVVYIEYDRASRVRMPR